ncbi:MAG: hypothetical protein IPM53_30000 [Anaerolineaceae bacterium]|nr:hypothetical protein [Anaerolineaceae bacterium]
MGKQKTASRMTRLAAEKQYCAWVLCPRIMAYAVVGDTSFFGLFDWGF